METCTSTVPARIETEHLSPVIEAPELETGTGESEYCGLWQNVHCRRTPRLEVSSYNLEFETPLCRQQLIWPR